VPLQRGSNAAGTTQQAWVGSPGQHHGAGGELPGPEPSGPGRGSRTSTASGLPWPRFPAVHPLRRDPRSALPPGRRTVRRI